MFTKPFPNSFRECRQRAGLLQRDVASSLGLDCTDRLSRWENGRAVPSIINLFKLAALYKVEPHALYPTLYKIVKQEAHIGTSAAAVFQAGEVPKRRNACPIDTSHKLFP